MINSFKNLKEVYFISEIGSNFDGSLSRAKDLIKLSKECGSQAVKFQNYTADSLVSDFGFKNLLGNNSSSHQDKWDKSVFETYDQASLNIDWMYELSETAKEYEIDFITSPYSIELLNKTNKFCSSIKIGSGDLTYLEIIKEALKKNKPTLIATGASTLEEVKRVMNLRDIQNAEIVLMQCNTNYTGNIDDDKYQNINVLKTYAKLFPNAILGLSCHSPNHLPVLASVTLGAKVIEKHFTDDKSRSGPDHGFAIEPKDWIKMVKDVRSLEKILGDGEKRIEQNELSTLIVQRRALYWNKDMKKGDVISSDSIACLRPCPEGAISASFYSEFLDKKLTMDVKSGELVKHFDNYI